MKLATKEMVLAPLPSLAATLTVAVPLKPDAAETFSTATDGSSMMVALLMTTFVAGKLLVSMVTGLVVTGVV